MKVRCVSNFYNEETREHLTRQSLRLIGSWHFKGTLTVGKEYLVIALTFTFSPPPDEQGPLVVIVPDAGYLEAFPLALFEVTDSRVSRYWELHLAVDREVRTTMVTLGPPSLLHNAADLLEQVVNGDPTAVEELDRVLDLLEAEAADSSR